MKNSSKLFGLMFVFLAPYILAQNQEEISEALQNYEEAKEASENYVASQEFTSSVRKAAIRGDAGSQWSLGSQYESGQGVPQNYIKAYVWYSVAAAQGGDFGEVASSARDTIGTKMSPSDLVSAQALAEKCFESDYKDCE